MPRAIKRIAFLAVFVLGLSALSYAQTIVSSIVGQVVDASGAVVPSVKVTITNEGTRISAQATTDAGGTYSVPNLYAGVYTVEAKKTGFEAVRFTGIQVLAAQTVRQDFVLKVGSVQQEVTVSGKAPLVHTDSMALGGEITNDQLRVLPVTWQSIDTFLSLVPGAQTGVSRWNPETGGAEYWGGTNFNVNGVAANDVGSGRGAVAGGLGLQPLPPVSSLQEFKVDADNMNAEYRAQVSVDMVTKQGSNKFHGSVYEYNQNAKLEASTLTLNASGIRKPPFNLNQFGGNLGGPIWRNKAFFFFNFAGFRQRQYNTVQLNFPTAAMRQGNFGAFCSSYDTNGICTPGGGTQIYNPWTGAVFAGNQIPQAMIATQAQKLVTYLPTLTTGNSNGAPNAAPNYVGLVSLPRDFDVYDLRLDYQLSSKDTLTGFSNHNVGLPWYSAGGTPPGYGNYGNAGYKTFIYQLAETHIFSPNTINDLRVGYTDILQIRAGQNLDFDPRSLFPQQPDSPQRGLPKMTFTGYAPIGDIGQGFYNVQPDVEIMENFTHVQGRHTLKAGLDVTSYSAFWKYPMAQMPAFSFTGAWTGNQGNPGQPQSVGNAFADFLVGAAATSSTSLPGHDVKFYDHDWELYFQDTWQATPKLTVYLGMRYVNQTPWSMRDNLRSYFDVGRNRIILPENSATPTLPPFGVDPATYNYFLPYTTTTKALGLPLNYYQDDSKNFGPRIGLAFRPFANSKTVLRGGYGVYYAFIPIGTTGLIDAESIPWSGTVGVQLAPLTFTTALPARPTSTYLPDITFSNPFPSAVGGPKPVAPNPSPAPTQRDLALPAQQSWNLTVERQVGASNMVRASYVGAQTHHEMWYSYDLNVPTTQTPNATIQSQRPLQPWGSFHSSMSGGKQNLNQLQLEYIRHFAHGLSAQAEYEWTRALTNDAWAVGGPQIPAYPKLDYTDNSSVVRHQLVFNYIYELPVGRGKHWMGNSPKVVDGILGGWQVAGITTYRTGLPFTVSFQVPSKAPYSNSWWGGRADRVSSNLYAKQSGHDTKSGVQWLNTAAFAPPQPWQWGDAPPYVAFGPGLANWDMSAQKYFHIPIRGLESPRLQFRADFLDAFNHFNLSAPSATIADTRDGGAAVSTAGKIFSGSGNRIIQIGLRFDF